MGRTILNINIGGYEENYLRIVEEPELRKLLKAGRKINVLRLIKIINQLHNAIIL